MAVQASQRPHGSATTPSAQFSAFAVRNGKFIAMGDAELAQQFPDFTRVDLQGKTVFPGLIDAHGHVLGLGLSLLQVDLRTSESASDAVNAVNDYAQQHRDLQWIKGRGWNQENWPSKRFPTAKQLDEFVADRPVYLTRVDGHAAWLNSKALEVADITSETV